MECRIGGEKMKLFEKLFGTEYMSWNAYQKKMQNMEREKWEHETIERNKSIIEFE